MVIIMKKLLIVEDDAVAIASMKKLTSQIGKTYVATTCKAAITMTHDIYPDIILLDLGLPDCTGFEVIEALKSDEKYFHIPIIVITSSSDRGSHLRAIRSGADDFLSKPFDYKLLKSRIDALFELQDKFLPPTIDVEYKAFDSKFSNVLGMLSEAVIVTNSLDEIELVNQYGLNLLGYLQYELVGRNINVIVPVSDCKILKNDDVLASSQDIANIPHNFNITTKLGKNLSVEINSAEYNDKKGLHFLTVVKDLTEKQAIQIKLLKSALFDPLTGLNTMTAFHIDFDKLASTEGTQGLISALMIDLDDFHDLNIIYGHKWCDNLLIDLANGIGSLSNVGSVRGYRMMGDRFLLCTCVDETQNAITKSDWIVNGVKDLISSLSQQLNIKLSITAASLSH
jgi:diguanylate cyclase (GGDEF)-like protein/PAS domain S-box-containing protein